jgi:hypothetical protein
VYNNSSCGNSAGPNLAPTQWFNSQDIEQTVLAAGNDNCMYSLYNAEGSMK